ncbi:hypothetical protein BH23CHL8_BH23CHL8_05400 [soil metagenome]
MESGLLALTQNVALLLSMAVVYDAVVSHWRFPARVQPVVVGVLIGLIGVVIILTPWEILEGIRLDSRGVLLSVSGLVLGAIPTLVAMTITLAFRLAEGGGVWQGVAFIVASGVLGLAWRRARGGRPQDISLGELALLGLVVQLVMTVLVATLPHPDALELAARAAIPELVVFPLASVLLGWLLLSHLRRDRVEAELRANEERMRLAVEAGDHGVWDLDLRTGEARVSVEYARMLGHDPERFRETLEAFLARLHADDREHVETAYREYVAGQRGVYRIECRQRTTSGEWRWILSMGEIVERDRAGRPLRMLGTHTDITSAREAEEQARAAQVETAKLLDEARVARRALLSMVEDLRDSEAAQRETSERYEGLVRLSPSAIFVNRDDRVTLVNEACLRLFGATSPDELLGCAPLDLFHPDDQEAIRERIRFLRHHRQAVPMREERIIRLDGQVVDVDVAAAPFDDGDATAIHVVVIDITERKRAEQEILVLNADLERRVKERTLELEEAYREMESFSYSVSHDLRAPLRAITGFSAILAQRHVEHLDEEGRHYLQNILTAGERMGELIDDLLAYARLGRGVVTLRAVPLAPIVAGLTEELSSRIAETGARVEVLEPLATPVGDRTLLLQVLGNLVGNALTYRLPDVAPHIRIGAVRLDGRVVVSVSDNGIGIAAENQERIFDVFARLHGDDEFPGTGIGLAIVRKATRLMGGDISLESAPGSGSNFSLSLEPAMRGAPAADG